MAQAGTNFPKMRRMLLCFSPSILGYFWPASTLFHGHTAVAIPSLLEIGVTLMRITWPNHSKRWILVSNVSMTYDGFSELIREIDEDFGGSIS